MKRKTSNNASSSNDAGSSNNASSADDVNNSDTAPAAPPEPPLVPVNSQIIDAVKQSTKYAFGLGNQLQPPVTDGTRLSSGAAIAYEKAAQAGSLAIQDAVDYQRNVLSISSVAQGKALAMMLADQSKIPQCTVVLVLALASSLAAAFTVGEIGTQVNKAVQGFPRA